MESLWKYGCENDLKWLLTLIPATQLHWLLDSTDEFTIEQTVSPDVSDAKAWACAMGIHDWSTQVTMRILSGDFVSWQRRVARQGANAPVGFTMESSAKAMMELKTTACWKANPVDSSGGRTISKTSKAIDRQCDPARRLGGLV
jgi:hypothetical protein